MNKKLNKKLSRELFDNVTKQKGYIIGGIKICVTCTDDIPINKITSSSNDAALLCEKCYSPFVNTIC